MKDKKVDASKTCEKTENADLASDLKAMKIIHPLQYRWAFWYLKGDRSKVGKSKEQQHKILNY